MEHAATLVRELREKVASLERDLEEARRERDEARRQAALDDDRSRQTCTDIAMKLTDRARAAEASLGAAREAMTAYLDERCAGPDCADPMHNRFRALLAPQPAATSPCGSVYSGPVLGERPVCDRAAGHPGLHGRITGESWVAAPAPAAASTDPAHATRCQEEIVMGTVHDAFGVREHKGPCNMRMPCPFHSDSPGAASTDTEVTK